MHFDFSVMSSSTCGLWDSHLSHHWAQNYVCVGSSKDRMCVEMEDDMKAGSKGFSCSMPVWLLWTDQQDCLVGCCLFWFSAWQMGFSCAPHSVYQFPIDKSILVTRHKGTHVQDSFCAGSGNRSTYSRVRWQSSFFVLHHLISYWKMWPQQLSVQWAVKWGGFALVSPLPPGTVQRSLLHHRELSLGSTTSAL